MNYLNSLPQVIWLTVQRFEGEGRRRDAAAMTYTTLFSLVPIITVSYSILSAIPALQSWGAEANQQLLSYVMPEGSSQISGYLQQFSQQARNLTWFGVPFLFVTAILLLRSIEMQFNRIWNVDAPSSHIQTFLRYWAVLSLGPLLFGAAFAATSLIASWSLWGEGLSLPALARLVPWLLSCAAITSVYMLVPNCRVPWRGALVAALLVSTFFEGGKFLFGKIMGMFPSYQLIYGAFAAVPLFLMWIYLSWMLLLFGAELSYSLSHFRGNDGGWSPLAVRLQVIASLTEAQNQQQVMTLPELESRLRCGSNESLEHFLSYARQQQWLLAREGNELLWIKDPVTLSMAELLADMPLQQLQQSLPEGFPAARDWQQSLHGQLQHAMDEHVSALLPQPSSQPKRSQTDNKGDQS